MKRRELLKITGYSLAAAMIGGPAFAATEAAREYFSGKSVRVLVPAGAGSGTDRSSRHFVGALQALLPNTRFRVENNERAGGQIMASLLWRAPPDGLTIGFPRNNLFYAAVLQPESMDFRFQGFTFVGSFTNGHRVMLLSNQSQIRSIDEVLAGDRFVMKAASSAVSSHYYEALLVNALAGSHIRPIPGYEGGARNMAVITGEVDCQIGTIEAIEPILETEAGHIVFRLTSDDLPEGFPDVPKLRDRLLDPSTSWAVDFLDAAASLGRPLAGPPGMDEQATVHWRTLFETVVHDPAYRAAAFEDDGVVIEPSSAERIAELLSSTAARGEKLKSDLEALLVCGQSRADSLSARCG